MHAAQISLGVSQPLLGSSLQSSCPPFLTATGFSHSPTFRAVWRLCESASYTAQLLRSPGVPWQLSFSGASVHGPSGCVPPLCVSHFISISPSDFQHPGPSWCQAALPALVGEGAGALTLLPVSWGRCPGPPQQPWSPRRSQGPYHPSAISSLSVFQCPLQYFSFTFRISWDSVGCSLRSSEDQLGVPAVHRENWAPLPPTRRHLQQEPFIPPTWRNWNPSALLTEMYNGAVTVETSITSVLNSPSDRLAIASWHSSLSGVLLCSFIHALILFLSAPVNL